MGCNCVTYVNTGLVSLSQLALSPPGALLVAFGVASQLCGLRTEHRLAQQRGPGRCLELRTIDCVLLDFEHMFSAL